MLVTNAPGEKRGGLREGEPHLRGPYFSDIEKVRSIKNTINKEKKGFTVAIKGGSRRKKEPRKKRKPLFFIPDDHVPQPSPVTGENCANPSKTGKTPQQGNGQSFRRGKEKISKLVTG